MSVLEVVITVQDIGNMKKIKKMFLRVVLVLEIIVFFGIYYTQIYGFKDQMHIIEENNILKSDIDNIIQEIYALRQEIENYSNNAFFKEKIAREELQLADADDQIYFID